VRTATAVPTTKPTAAPGELTAAGAIIARVPVATGAGNKDLEVIRDGDMPPVGNGETRRQYDTNDGKNESDEDWIGYAFASPQTFSRILFQEGMHFARGGWFSSLTVHVRQNGVWSPVSSLTMSPQYIGANNGLSYETYDLSFRAITGDAIRIWGRPGGKDDFISVGELRVFSGTPASPGATATPVRTATTTPVRTSTPLPTATAPPFAPTQHPTAAATATTGSQPTAQPTVAATPAPGLCGNGVRDAAEQCDGTDPTGCPGFCQADCSCATSFTFPLDGWGAGRGQGPRAGVEIDADAGDARVLVVDAAPGGNGELSYPERPSLELPFPILSFTSRTGDGSRLQLTVRAVDGRTYQLTYTAAEGVPLASKRQSVFPIGRRSNAFRTTLRDLRADLHAAFNVEFAAVEQVTVRGPIRLAEIIVAAPGVLPAAPVQAAEIALPTDGWSQQGAGTVVENEYDADLAAPTLRTEPRNAKRAKIAVSFPKKDTLAAAYRTFSLVVREEQQLAIEVRVRVKRGIARLRYEAGLDAPFTKGRKTTLPLVVTPVDGSMYRLVTIDLAADLARVVPGATLDGVLTIRVQGKFRMGDLVLREPM